MIYSHKCYNNYCINIHYNIDGNKTAFFEKNNEVHSRFQYLKEPMGF